MLSAAETRAPRAVLCTGEVPLDFVSTQTRGSYEENISFPVPLAKSTSSSLHQGFLLCDTYMPSW